LFGQGRGLRYVGGGRTGGQMNKRLGGRTGRQAKIVVSVIVACDAEILQHLYSSEASY